MKLAIVFTAISCLLWPTVALADPPDCARLLRQIYHYEDMVMMAEDRGKPEWAAKTQGHVDRLEDQLGVRCPRYSDRDEKQEIAKSLAAIAKAAASAAATFFSLGAF
jgi:hypothetical protein